METPTVTVMQTVIAAMCDVFYPRWYYHHQDHGAAGAAVPARCRSYPCWYSYLQGFEESSEVTRKGRGKPPPLFY